MTLFWIIAVLLIVFAALFILLGRNKRRASSIRSKTSQLSYRDQLRELDAELASGTLSQEQYQNTRNELVGRLLEDSDASDYDATSSSGRWLFIMAVITVPALTIALYFLLGKPVGLKPSIQAEEVNQSPGVTNEQIEAMVERLAKKLKTQPNDVKGWAMLGNSYTVQGRYKDSADAYERAIKLSPNDAQMLADYADVLAMSQGKVFQGKPEEIIQKALSANPGNIKALSLAGSAAFQRKDYNSAITYWQNLAKLLPAGDAFSHSVSANIVQAQQLADQDNSGAQAATSQVQPTSGNATISGSVNLDPVLRSRVADTDIVFIFARNMEVQNSPPLAILRKTVKDLPISFTFDDSMAMLPNIKLSSASQILVGARISKSGSAIPSPGDLQGFSQPVKLGERGIAIKIESEVK